MTPIEFLQSKYPGPYEMLGYSKGTPIPTRLSPREIEVLEMLGDGWSTREIAEELKLSPKTVETYREEIKRKLGLPNSQKLIHFAMLVNLSELLSEQPA